MIRVFAWGRTTALCAALAFCCPAGAVLAGTVSDLQAQQARGEAEYEQLARRATLSDQKLAALTEEIAGIKKDQATITAALIQAAKTEHKLSQDIEDIGAKLEDLKGQQQTIRMSLVARRDVLAEVLGALQRMGLNPPPAILVKPEDALSSVRSAILLGAVVPELRAADRDAARRPQGTVAGDGLDRGRARPADADGRGAGGGEEAAQHAARRQAEAAGRNHEAALADEQAKAAELAAKAGSLKELIASLETQIARTCAAEKAGSRAGALQRGRRWRQCRSRSQPAGGRAFLGDEEGRSRCRSPAASSAVSATETVTAAVMHGDMVATQSGAIVTAPADGNVLYAGPFRSYGQLLILNAGDGYHVVLAGMGRISVAPGQSVLAGEPVGAMGEARVASTSASGNGNTTPELYVEFRKDGKPVDPAPWWADRFSGRT